MGEAFRLSVKAAKTTKPGDYCDGQGLWLVVASASARKWVFRFSFEGVIKEMGLGPVNAVSLGQARDRAQAARELVATGDNPIEARRIAKTKRGCPSFGEVASELIASKRSGWRSDIHARQWGALQDQCAPIWNKPVDAIGVIDVLDTLKPIWVRTPQTASRVRARIAATFDYAKAKGFRSGENPAAWKGHLEHILPRRQKVEQPHFGAMPYREIPAFVASLREHTDASHLAIEFLILTACRSAEARAATWQEIDLARAAWTLHRYEQRPARLTLFLLRLVPSQSCARSRASIGA